MGQSARATEHCPANSQHQLSKAEKASTVTTDINAMADMTKVANDDILRNGCQRSLVLGSAGRTLKIRALRMCTVPGLAPRILVT